MRASNHCKNSSSEKSNNRPWKSASKAKDINWVYFHWGIQKQAGKLWAKMSSTSTHPQLGVVPTKHKEKTNMSRGNIKEN